MGERREENPPPGGPPNAEPPGGARRDVAALLHNFVVVVLLLIQMYVTVFLFTSHSHTKKRGNMNELLLVVPGPWAAPTICNQRITVGRKRRSSSEKRITGTELSSSLSPASAGGIAPPITGCSAPTAMGIMSVVLYMKPHAKF
jgi:hypothetical protein